MSRKLFLAPILMSVTFGGAWAEDGAPDFKGQLPTIKITKVTPGKIGAKLTAEVDNPNPFAIAFMNVDCIGSLAGKTYVYGPGRAYFVQIDANSKATGEFDLIIDNVLKVISAEPDIKEFPEPSETKCQVTDFQSPIGVEPAFAYKTERLKAPAN